MTSKRLTKLKKSKSNLEKSATLRNSSRKSNVIYIFIIITAEFSSFSKNFSEKAPKPKAGLKDFLNMFDSHKSDPSKSAHDS